MFRSLGFRAGGASGVSGFGVRALGFTSLGASGFRVHASGLPWNFNWSLFFTDFLLADRS